MRAGTISEALLLLDPIELGGSILLGHSAQSGRNRAPVGLWCFPFQALKTWNTALFSCNLIGWSLGWGCGTGWPGASELSGLESQGPQSRQQSLGGNWWLTVQCL